MLKQATVTQIRRQELPRENSHIVIAMRRYPRGIRKEWADDFCSSLSPDLKLFSDFRKIKETEEHNEAFTKAGFQARFTLGDEGLLMLQALSEKSASQKIYLVCQCEIGQFCHRELLLLMARHLFKASIDTIFNNYPDFEKRLKPLRHSR